MDYDAYDVGATYETGAWGFMVSYGADMNQLTGQATRALQGSIDYSFTDKLPLGADFQIGAGVQYVEGDGILSLTPSAPGALSSTRDDESMAVFLETLVSF